MNTIEYEKANFFVNQDDEQSRDDLAPAYRIRKESNLMNTTDKEKNEINATPSTNQRLVTILLVLLIVLVVLLVIGIIVGFLMMSGMMDGWRWMMGPHGQIMNNMVAVCTDIMRNIRKL